MMFYIITKEFLSQGLLEKDFKYVEERKSFVPKAL